MKRARKIRERSTERTKGQLLESAKKAFARHGFHGATVQQIAKDAGVNVSLINHHFGGKEALYRSCLSGFSAKRLASLDRFLAAPKSVADFRARLELMVGELLEEHLAEPEVIRILLRDVNDPELCGEDLERQLFGFTDKLAQVFGAAKQRGFLRAETDPLVAAAMLYLSFSGLIQVGAHVERLNGINLRDPATRRELVEKTLDVVLNGVLKERHAGGRPRPAGKGTR